jgi:hypothetical protein
MPEYKGYWIALVELAEVRDRLQIGLGLDQLLGAAMQEPDMRITAFRQVAAEAHHLGLVTGVTVHTFNRWQWAAAEFVSETAGRFAIDALAVKYGDGAPPLRMRPV